MTHVYLNKLLLGIVALFFISASHLCLGQIQIDTSRSADQLVKEILLGEGVVVGNVTYTGPKYAIAHFTDPSKMLSVSEGILLTTGSALMCKGPNEHAGMGWVSRAKGFPKLDSIAKGETHDAAVLAFDFIPTAEVLIFNFIFASEEYQEYVDSKYNDVFAFFLNGPGIHNVNLATLPRSKTPVTINSINHKTNKKYYVDNPTFTYNDRILYDVRRKKTIRNKNFGKEAGIPKYDLQYDGFTTVLEATCRLVPGEVYRIEMAIADVGDFSLDSGIFLEARSFRSLSGSYVSLKRPFPNLIENPSSKIPNLPSYTDSGNKARMSEAEELSRKPEETIIETAQSVNYQVTFAFDSYVLADSMTSVLDEICATIHMRPEAVVEVVGHTDYVGSDLYNDQLSKCRAETVVNYLLTKGIQAQIATNYKGEREPADTNLTDVGRARNRRTEIAIKIK